MNNLTKYYEALTEWTTKKPYRTFSFRTVHSEPVISVVLDSRMVWNKLFREQGNLLPWHHSWWFETGKDHMKNMDTIRGCEWSLVQFFSEWIPSSYLDEKLAALESHEKTGVCYHCLLSKEINSLVRFTACKWHQYCPWWCHTVHWPKHNEWCKEQCKKNGRKRSGR